MPSFDYDLIVLGGGTAGLTAASLAVQFGARTMLIEAQRLGGDCTWTGCVPSKTLLRAAKVVHQGRHASRYGLTDVQPQVPFRRLMAHVHGVRQAVYEEANAPAIYECGGVAVRHGRARFTNPHRVEIESEDGRWAVTARRFVIATGARPAVPDLPGLSGVRVLTSETIFEIEEQPRALTVLGAGALGIELAQAFCRLGTETTVVERHDRILLREDAEHAGTLRDILMSEGVRFVLGAAVERVAEAGGQVALHARVNGQPRIARADALLVATGRRPNVEDLGLEAAGVAFTERGITVDARGRTSQRHIYAVGDVTGAYNLAHMSEHTARVAVWNAVLGVPAKIDHTHVPWTTFTDPELGHIGATEPELQARGARYEVVRYPYTRLDRAVLEAEPIGQVKVFATPWRGRILGASILGDRAGELISLLAVAMRNGLTLRQLADTIYPRPTYGLAAHQVAAQWSARRLYPQALRLLRRARLRTR